MNFSENQVLEVLRKVVHPASGKDVIAMNLVNDLACCRKKHQLFAGISPPLTIR